MSLIWLSRKMFPDNALMGFLHLIQGILMIVLSNDTTYPIFTNFLSFDRETFSLVPDPKAVLRAALRSGGCALPADLGSGALLAVDSRLPGTSIT
jgi:hypothetical protein